MTIADLHCHLGMYVDPDAVLDRAAKANVHVVVATCRASEFRGLANFAGETVSIGLGLHPELAGSAHAEHELRLFEHHASDAVWISEVGLDAIISTSISSNFGATPTLDAQRELFAAALQLAGPNVVYSVHSRGAEQETVRTLMAHGCRHVALHSFMGDERAAAEAVEAGYFFSIHPTMLEERDHVQVVRQLPLSRLLLETDGPYYQFAGSQIEPSNCAEIIGQLAACREAPIASVAEAIEVNSRAFLQLASPRDERNTAGAPDADQP